MRQRIIGDGGERHEKDDRYRLDDRTRYVLGWSNKAKVLAFEQEADGYQERMRLIDMLVSGELPWTGDEGYRKAEVTGGGVSLAEVHAQTMESKRHPGLYICGEVLDIPADARTRTTIKAASGQPTWRVLTRDNKEIHRCEMPTRPADWYPAARVVQAQGIVSVQANCSTIAALAMMQERARVQDRPLDELAQTILDGGERFYSRPRDH